MSLLSLLLSAFDEIKLSHGSSRRKWQPIESH